MPLEQEEDDKQVTTLGLPESSHLRVDVVRHGLPYDIGKRLETRQFERALRHTLQA